VIARQPVPRWTAKLADLVGTGQPSIARIESGRTLPKLDVIARIAHALGFELAVTFKKVPPARAAAETRTSRAHPKKASPSKPTKTRARAVA